MINPFQRLTVEYAVEGGARVTWFLAKHFTDPLPHEFQLEVTKTSAPTANDWLPVGLPVQNGFYAIDDEKRMWGKSPEVHYRVSLTTPVDTYYSGGASLASIYTNLPYRDWLDARDLYRQYKKSLAKFKGTEGYLLKRKRFGQRCQTCLDPVLLEGTRSNCPECFGTEVTAGYYAAVPGFFVDLSTQSGREKTDLGARATIKDIIIGGLCPGDILVNSRDLFVEKRSSVRYNIETVGTESEHRGYPICLKLELRQVEFSSIAYQVPLEGN